MIGDRFSDIKAAMRAGINSVLLISGAKDKQTHLACRPTSFASTLVDATTWVLNDFKQLLSVAHEIYSQNTLSSSVYLLKGKSIDHCRSVSRILQQHFLPQSIIFDYHAELKHNQHCNKIVRDRLMEIINLSSEMQIEYSEIIGSESYGCTWSMPKVTLIGMPGIIVPIGFSNISLNQMLSCEIYDIEI